MSERTRAENLCAALVMMSETERTEADSLYTDLVMSERTRAENLCAALVMMFERTEVDNLYTDLVVMSARI